MVQPLTNDRAIAINKVKELTATGETAVHDAVLSAGSMMSVGNWSQRRIVVLTDGEDTASDATVEELRQDDRRGGHSRRPHRLPDDRQRHGPVERRGHRDRRPGLRQPRNALALNNIFANAAKAFSALLLVQRHRSARSQ